MNEEFQRCLAEATDEIAEVLADFDVPSDDLIAIRHIIKERVERAQASLLKIALEGLKKDRPKGDYRYCETCDLFFDFWKYGDYESAGHGAPCVVRKVTDEEYENCLKDCWVDGCVFDDTW